ncbi:hypothetical protein [Streptomyces pactum]|uniref:hypothetical protein n=1 Tax=Streptomyces pactum TaxID=68249 RepID=UPI000AA12072|nr:hypothetical protein [Streptomyces pactum]
MPQPPIPSGIVAYPFTEDDARLPAGRRHRDGTNGDFVREGHRCPAAAWSWPGRV